MGSGLSSLLPARLLTAKGRRAEEIAVPMSRRWERPDPKPVALMRISAIVDAQISLIVDAVSA